MKEYISKELMNEVLDDLCVVNSVYNELNDIPVADVREVVYANWKLHRNGSGTCSHCRRTSRAVYDDDGWQNYCGHCGAIMDLEDE